MLRSLFVAAACHLVFPFTQAQPSETFDVLIQNGRVMDGSGAPPVATDVGIRGGVIVAVRRLNGSRAARIIDAGGNLVTPGFIDVHSHAGEGLYREGLRQAQPLLAQGVTTAVLNPDGGGPVDLAAQRARLLTGGIGPNAALLIGHGSVRRAVIGGAKRAPTPEELEKMRALVRRGMEDGAYGLSSGLFYVPGSYAKTEEVIELTKVAAERGGLYTSHVRDEGNYNVGIVASVEEVIRIAEAAKTIGIVSHVKALGPDSWGLGKTITQRIDAARARGVQVYTDQYPYDASSTNLRAALLPDGVEPSEPVATENLRRRGGAKSIVIAHFGPDHSLEGKSLEEIAAAQAVSPVRAALDIIARGGASIVSFNMSEDDIAVLMKQPYTMTSSDGGLVLMTEGKPHPRNYGAFARKLSRYVRERHTVTLEQAIRSMTSLPAGVFGLKDRGVIKEGAAADIAIFDPARIVERATYTDPHHLAEGMDYVLVNGEIVVDRGQFTAAMPGKVLRKH